MPIVLFVCIENSFRSVMAEALFNANAPAGWRAESAGVEPRESLNPRVVPLMAEVRLDVSRKEPR
ncbi:MAG TPA: low molecular weight phosphatase family protein, partial [Thermoplasmata archaeon]